MVIGPKQLIHTVACEENLMLVDSHVGSYVELN